MPKRIRSTRSSRGVRLARTRVTVSLRLDWIAASTVHDTNRIYVVAPSTTEERLRRVTESTSGFIYAASLMGVTGTRTSVSSSARELVTRVRGVSDLPVAVGLGVSTPEQAREVAQYADGVIVGSAFIRLLQESSSLAEGVERVRELASELSKGLIRK